MSEYNRTWVKVLNVVRENSVVRKGVAYGPHLTLTDIQFRFEDRYNEWVEPKFLQRILREHVHSGNVEKHGHRTYRSVYNRALLTGVTERG